MYVEFDVPSDTIFAPYQFVAFEAMTLDSKKAQVSGMAEMIYFFYDNAEMLEKDVIFELKEGVQYCSDYSPGLLEEMYINKEGTINITREELCKIIHPSDRDKIEDLELKKRYKCIDADAQYLVLENETLRIRVLPPGFPNQVVPKGGY